MKRQKNNNRNKRRGAITVLACFLMIALLAMLAFAIDLGYLANSQAELQRSADSAALAACYELVYQGTPGTSVDLSGSATTARSVASQYAGLNRVCSSAPGLSSSDVVVGYLSDPTQPSSTITTTSSANIYNAVQVTIRREANQNGQVPTFFGRIFGVEGENAGASATAALINNFSGFKIPSTNGGSDSLMILPFALDLQTWNVLVSDANAVSSAGGGCNHGGGQGGLSCGPGGTSDSWCYNSNGTVTSGTDGILEVNLFPQGTGSPGNRGTVNIGASNNSTATLCRQITSGISAADLAYYPNSELKFNSTGHLYLNADPGISAGCKSALESIIGQTRIIPIFNTVVGNGNNATYDIVKFVGVRIMAVKLTGAMTSKYLMVQPTVVYTRGGIPSTSSTTQYTYGTYSPVWLVK